MKQALNIVGILLALTGVIWVLQGINLLPGSFMTGQIQWAIIGAVFIVIGVGMLIYNRRSGQA